MKRSYEIHARLAERDDGEDPPFLGLGEVVCRVFVAVDLIEFVVNDLRERTFLRDHARDINGHGIFISEGRRSRSPAGVTFMSRKRHYDCVLFSDCEHLSSRSGEILGKLWGR